MDAAIVPGLIAATPFLAGGYLVNLLISLGAMALGTVLGVALGLARRGPGRVVADGLTEVARNVPSFVLLFFLAAVLPERLGLGALSLPVDARLTALLALTLPVVGFAADATDQVMAADAEQRVRRLAAMAVAWVQYFVVILMASTTASVIGVDEIVARSNQLVSIEAEPAKMLVVYLFVALWFIVPGALLLALGRRLGDHLAHAEARS
jgi:ABC-type amino acid transport system permease subunit